MTDILIGTLIGVGGSYISRLCVLAYRKLRVIIKEDRENRRYFYGLSKSKRLILDEIITTRKTLLDNLNSLNGKDKSIHHDLLGIVQNLTNRTMQMTFTFCGEAGVKYVQAHTDIMYFSLNKK